MKGGAWVEKNRSTNKNDKMLFVIGAYDDPRRKKLLLLKFNTSVVIGQGDYDTIAKFVGVIA